MLFKLFPILFLVVQVQYGDLVQLEGDRSKERDWERWERFHPYQNKEVKLRGFLYNCPSGQVALLGKPGVRSCCVQNPEKGGPCVYLRGDQIEVSDDLVAEIEGIFTAKVIRGEEGVEILYELKEARVHQASYDVPIAFLIVTGILALSTLLYFGLRDKFHLRSYLDMDYDDYDNT